LNPTDQPTDQDEALRERIAVLLSSSDFETDWRVRADDSQRFQAVVGAVRASDGELATKLRIAGFTDRPVPHDGIDQACETCMYFLTHRRWCALPELDLPVRPEWSCNVWRI
jgi:hypothetical protein